MRFDAFACYSAEVGVMAEVVVPELQNTDYESGVAQIGGEAWHIRTARNTPTKPGAFVAFWRRGTDGSTIPFGEDDPTAGLLVFVNQNHGRGVFRFTGVHLSDLGITSGKRPGKRGFRVYPSWCAGLNSRAETIQRAQSPAFQEF
ncbi:MepB family protein [Kocuria massiliensis]|uniref:MepB family protein n=1 Tax=Kocuria massiliensis TaxID=1926282 RepID=UPI0022B9D1CC|nr:MepB family protein [Kocuria massiliensis]